MILRLKECFSQLRFVPNPCVEISAPASVETVKLLLQTGARNGGGYQEKAIGMMLISLILYCWKVAFSHSFAAECLVFTTNEPFKLLDRDLADQCLGKKQISSAVCATT